VARLVQLAALYAFHLVVVRPIVYFVLGTRSRRRHLLPEAACVVVANHNSHLDAALLMSLFPLRRLKDIHPAAAADYFGKNWLRRTMAMALMNGIPIERHPVAGQDPLAPMIRALDAGKSLIFFPEGSRGEPGVVAPFRPGVGRIVQQRPDVPVVPVWLAGPERIWPRGETVPVPVAIDVQIGKPRTYPPELDAREIAQAVREDVLQLAPPPPPAPGPRPVKPMRVAVCGIDPAVRRAVAVETAKRLSADGPAVCLSEPVLRAEGGEIREWSGEISAALGRKWPAFLASLFRTGGLFHGMKFAQAVERARVDRALEDGRFARYLVGDGNALVDLLAWAEADFYKGQFDEREIQQLMRFLSGERRIGVDEWWRYVRKAPEVWLINVFDLAHPSVPEILALLREPAAAAVRRIEQSGRKAEPYENEAFLDTLQQAYERVAKTLDRPGRTVVVELEVGTLPIESLASAVVDAARLGAAAPATVDAGT
jgi:1-acyl-sn-glycerol-3-phosphate acyltransferase